MKPIMIAERLRPFSHQPGACCLLPGTWWSVQAFPTRLVFAHGEKSLVCDLAVTGPVDLFTIQQDLEKGVVFVFGKAQEGYFRLRITATPNALIIHVEKVPLEGLESSWGILKAKESLSIPMQWTFSPPSRKERLSLGRHRAQEWEGVLRRSEMQEMVPYLFSLAQEIPHASCSKCVFSQATKLEHFFQVHCRSLLVPRLVDDLYQGIQLFPDLDCEPCSLLHATAQWIRSLLVRSEGSEVYLLPLLPSSWDAGRLTNFSLGPLGSLDLEWSKSSLRKAAFRAAFSGEITIHLPRGIKQFRENGVYQKTAQPFMVKERMSYFLDRFCD